MILVIAEKPSLAKDIANVLPGPRKSLDGAISCGNYVVTWAWGHLLTLKMPEDYDPALKTWEMATLPIYFKNWGKKVSDQGYGDKKSTSKETPADRLRTIKTYLDKADQVIHAGDSDDEGQYLIDEILEWCNYKGKVWRLDTSDNSANGLSNALRTMKDNATQIPIGRAAYARSVADLMIGVNLSRYFSLSNPEVLISIGRVQTPTLGLVVKRDSLIDNHTVIYYYTVTGQMTVNGITFDVHYVPDPQDPNLTDGRILHKNYADEILNKLLAAGTFQGDVTKKIGKDSPPLPFNKTELSVYAEKKWGYDPLTTLNITQTLRDNHKAISYNRTDCRYLTENQFAEAPAVMDAVVKNINFRPKALDMTVKSKAFNDKMVMESQEAHTAIIPQAVSVNLNKLTGDERNIYLAICKYYMAQFMPPATKERTKFSAPCPCGGTLEGTAVKVLDPGWTAIFRETEKEEESPLNDIAPGNYTGAFGNGEVKEGHTNPPPRYTLATLEKDMSQIAKYVENPRVKSILLAKDAGKTEENGSIGTVATRPKILENLMQKGYLEPLGGKGNKIQSTILAREMCRILPKELVEPELTAVWWAIQEDIKNKVATEDTLTDNVMEFVRQCLKTNYPRIDMKVVPDRLKKRGSREALGVCPACGQPVVEGKIGYGCSGYKAGCKFVIWKTSKRPMLKGVTITASDVKKFLAGEPVLKKNLKKKDGGTFEAYLRMTYDPTSAWGTSLDPDFTLKTPGYKAGGGKGRKSGGTFRKRGGGGA